jgi:hypothetical protein
VVVVSVVVVSVVVVVVSVVSDTTKRSPVSNT